MSTWTHTSVIFYFHILSDLAPYPCAWSGVSFCFPETCDSLPDDLPPQIYLRLFDLLVFSQHFSLWINYSKRPWWYSLLRTRTFAMKKAMMITPTTMKIVYSVTNAMTVSNMRTSLDVQNHGLLIKHQTIQEYLMTTLIFEKGSPALRLFSSS
jgi:hypothetical protein